MDLVVGRIYKNLTYGWEEVKIESISMELIKEGYRINGEKKHEVVKYRIMGDFYRSSKTTSYTFRQRFIDYETIREEKLNQLGI